MNRPTVLLIVLAAIAVAISGCGSSSTSSTGTERSASSSQPDSAPGSAAESATEGAPGKQCDHMTKVRYGVSTATPNVDQAAYTSLPRVLGYWQDECLDVDVLGFDGSGAVFQAIDSGRIDAGNGPPGPLFVADAQGSNMTAVYDYVPKNFLMPMLTSTTKITSPKQLASAAIGVANLQAGGVTLIQAMAAKEGIQPNSLNLIPIGTGAQAAEFIKQGKIDVVELWDSAYAQLEQMGIKLKPLKDKSFENFGFFNVITAKSNYIKNNRDTMVKIARGIAEANLFAHTNPEAAAKLHWKEYPASRPTGVSEKAALAQAVAMIKARNSHTGKLPGKPWGYADASIISSQMKMLLDTGVIKKDIPIDKVWDGSLLKDINSFNESDIKEQAKNWNG